MDEPFAWRGQLARRENLICSVTAQVLGCHVAKTEATFGTLETAFASAVELPARLDWAHNTSGQDVRKHLSKHFKAWDGRLLIIKAENARDAAPVRLPCVPPS